MARKLFVMLAATVLTVMPLSVNALGFGNIRVISALNERMDAEIDLIDANEADIKDLKVSIASQNAFLRAGIERSSSLLGLRFSVNRRSNGKYYIKVSSRDSVREPFLNFLLEMDWKNGRMLREYTVLLDPPGRMQHQPSVVASPQTQAPAVVAKEEQKAATSQETPFIPPPTPAPVVQAEPVPAPIEKADDGQLFPRIPLTEFKGKEPQPAKVSKPEMAQPKPVAAKPAPKMEPLLPEPVAKPEKAKPSSEMAGMPADSGKPIAQADEDKFPTASPEQPFEDIDQLYPTIPLSAYTNIAATDLTGKTATKKAPVTGNLDYGITKKGDNLWKIAENLRGTKNKAVTIDQVMMALLRSNPSAFIKGNVHRLKIGQVLRIDDPGLLTAMSAKQAAQEYLAQTQAWNEYRKKVAAAKTPAQPEMASDTTAPAESATSPAASQGELVLSPPESSDLTSGVGTKKGKTVTSGPSDADLLREEVRKSLAEAKTAQGKNTALNEHLRDLEGEVTNLQRSMTVKDDELAALQQQLSAINKREEPAPVEAAPVEKQSPEKAQTEITPATEVAPVAEPATPETAPAPVSPAQTAPKEVMPQSGLPPQQEETQAPPAPVTKAPPAEHGFMDKAVAALGGIIAAAGGVLSTLSINPLYLGIIGGVVVLLLILLVILLKRRKNTDNFQESILSGATAGGTSESAAASVSAAEPASLDTNFSEESSFLSDFAISGAGAIQAEDSEVDPLTEADVFMAYGRHEAAEERLIEAIKLDPNRKELKLKLLELYNTTKNRDSFEPLAEEFYASLGDSANGDPMWEKVLIMGANIASDNPLFGNAPASSSMHESEEDFSNISNAGMSDSQVMDIGLDTGVFNTSDFDAPIMTPEDESSASLDFNLDFGGANDSSEESTASLDFNLGEADEDTDTVKAPDVSSDKDEDVPGADLDFNFDSSTDSDVEAEPTTTSMKAPDLDDNEMSLDFDMDSDPTESTAPHDFDLDSDLTESTASHDFDLDSDSTESTASHDFDMDSDSTESTASLDFEMDSDSTESTASLDFDMGDDITVKSEPAAEEGFSLDLGDEDSAAGLDLNLDATDAASDLDDIGSVDEVGTKLDLAKAYIDMGDPEGARSILDEVMEEGDASQKQEAQQLIQQIV